MDLSHKSILLGLSSAVALALGASEIGARVTPLEENQTPIALRDALVNEASARSLTLASMMDPGATKAQRAALLQRAIAIDPDNALSYWLLANSDVDAHVIAKARDHLLRIEPQNGAVQLLTLGLTDANDISGIDEILGAMANAITFDDHLGDVVVAWIDQLSEHSALIAVSPGAAEQSLGLQGHRLTLAMGYGTGVDLPSYRHLQTACSAQHTAKNELRRTHCAQIGKRIASHGTSLVSRVFGVAVLKQINAPSAIESSRSVQYLSIGSSDLFEQSLADAADVATLVNHWRETHSEVSVLERLLVRSKEPISPPADWNEAAAQAEAMNRVSAQFP
jgi:hypothetical protein